MAAASLHALLEHSIDYAGLFPPAELALQPALENQSSYVRSDDRWMLGAFVLPAGKFSAAAPYLALFDSDHPLRVSALGPKTTTVFEFQVALRDAVKAIKSFSTADSRVSVEQFEMPLPPGAIADSLGGANAFLDEFNLEVFWETPAERAVETIESLAGGSAGFKLRTGGVTADAFPTSRQIAKALIASGRCQVPIKFTAGLHHPVRLFHSSVLTRMHGFLNVLGAGVLAAEHSWNEEQTEEMLNDEEPKAFIFEEAKFAWRNAEISTAQIRARRQLVTSLGSCSFDEPRDDLRALALLP